MITKKRLRDWKIKTLNLSSIMIYSNKIINNLKGNSKTNKNPHERSFPKLKFGKISTII